jgi:hypothetical protein
MPVNKIKPVHAAFIIQIILAANLFQVTEVMAAECSISLIKIKYSLQNSSEI